MQISRKEHTVHRCQVILITYLIVPNMSQGALQSVPHMTPSIFKLSYLIYVSDMLIPKAVWTVGQVKSVNLLEEAIPQVVKPEELLRPKTFTDLLEIMIQVDEESDCWLWLTDFSLETLLARFSAIRLFSASSMSSTEPWPGNSG